ncbi:MAG TPA: LysR family transcriptional regulator [Solirubrobacteraceae bacterium]|jgi:DNA-binding transcriptional LysR family regulator
MLDVRRLRVLREVACRGSFSAAAESLSFTQSAISQHVAALERETGTQLVERGPRTLRLTDAGAALVRHTEVILARLADAEAELEAIAGLRAGRVRLVSFPSAGATIVPAAVAVFRSRHPEVEVDLAMAEPELAIPALRSGEHDVALTIGSPSPVNEGVELELLVEDPLRVALPRDHRLAGRDRVRLADLSDELWLFGATERCPDRHVFVEACRSAGFEPEVTIESDDYNAIQGFVAAGVGVALIPEIALVTVRDDIVIRTPTGPPPVRQILAATTAASNRSPATQAMLAALREASAQFRAGERPDLVAV